VVGQHFFDVTEPASVDRDQKGSVIQYHSPAELNQCVNEAMVKGWGSGVWGLASVRVN